MPEDATKGLLVVSVQERQEAAPPPGTRALAGIRHAQLPRRVAEGWRPEIGFARGLDNFSARR
eukprot:4858586-Pyramimonas_sp.AAC.1